MKADKSQWFTVAAFALVAASTQMLWLTFAPLTTEAATYYNVSDGAIGTLSVIFPLVYVVFAIPAGLLLDRWFRPTLATGAIATAFGGVIRLFGDSFVLILVGQIFIAIAQPFVINAVTKLAVEYTREKDRPSAIGVGSAGMFVGMLLALGMGAALGGDRIPELLAIQAVIGVLSAIWLCFELAKPGKHGHEGPGEQQATERPLRTVWADKYIRALVTVVFIGFGVFVALTTWMEVLLEPAGVGVTQAGVLLIAMVVAGIVGSAVIPPIVAKRNKQLTWLMAAVVVTALGCFVLAAVPGFNAGLPVSAVMGFVLLTALPVMLELAERRAGSASGSATALIWMAGNAGGLVVSLIVQLLLNVPALAFGIMGVIVLLGIPFVLYLKRYPSQSALRKDAGHVV